MKQSWLNNVIPIAALFSFRMLGLFMLIPVFSVYAAQLHFATPVLIGVALGIYGLAQGILQIPFGMFSDRFGRKPAITLGLCFFVSGSLLGAWTDSIYGMIMARTLQGMGAIGSVLVALLADLTPDEQRTNAMAVIGVTIGLSFSLALLISPPITHAFGLSGIFYLTTILAILGLLLLHLVIPTPIKEPFHMDSGTNLTLFKSVLSNHHLQRLNVGIFCQHCILTSTFFAIPILLQQQIKLGHLSHSWHFYFPLMVLSFMLMVPFIVLAERKQWIKLVFLTSVSVTTICQFLLSFFYQDWYGMCIFLFIYFIGFNILEASLPSLTSRLASPESKGTAMGIYSSSQFLGIFTGGALSGIVYQFAESRGIFLVNSIIGLVWVFIAAYMQPSFYLTTLIIRYPTQDEPEYQLDNQLKQLRGVKNVIISPEEEIIYMQINKAFYQAGSAERLIKNRNSTIAKS